MRSKVWYNYIKRCEVYKRAMPLSQHATANTLGYNLDKPASHVSEELS